MPVAKEQIRQIIADIKILYLVMDVPCTHTPCVKGDYFFLNAGYIFLVCITAGANETSKFWLGMLNDLKNRGVQDVLFFCVDRLSVFGE